jgi:NAD+ synthase (glutamine-hydrolysing)
MALTAEVLHEDLVRELNGARKIRNFDAKQWVDQKADMFNEYLNKAGLKACLVSVSGGIDSAVTFALMKYAQQKKGSPLQRVIGIAQPIKSTEAIWKRAFLLEKAFNAEIITVDQSALHTQLQSLCDTAIGITGNQFSNGQLKSYMRTPVNFYVAQLLSQNGTPCVVLGTGNYDEDGYLYYFCKAGDGVADIQLINDLHKSEVFAVGRELGVPKEILDAPPSADLWSDQTDENELGFTYDFVELLTEYLRWDEKKQNDFVNSLSSDAKAQWQRLREKAESIHRRNRHKERYPLNLNILPTKPDSEKPL